MGTYMDAVNGKHSSDDSCMVSLPMFSVGDSVIASPKDGDFDHEFTGTVIGHRKGIFQVEDQDGNVFDCDESQLESD